MNLTVCLSTPRFISFVRRAAVLNLKQLITERRLAEAIQNTAPEGAVF